MQLTMEELLREVARRTARLTFADGRVAAELTERNVRYYVTLGVVRPPLRDGHRSVWTNDHVLDLVRVRRAQHEGLSLKLIGRPAAAPEPVPAWRRANSPLLRGEALAPMGSYQLSETDRGWTVRLGRDVFLSGFGAAPTDAELAGVREALQHRLAAAAEFGGDPDRDPDPDPDTDPDTDAPAEHDLPRRKDDEP